MSYEMTFQGVLIPGTSTLTARTLLLRLHDQPYLRRVSISGISGIFHDCRSLGTQPSRFAIARDSAKQKVTKTGV